MSLWGAQWGSWGLRWPRRVGRGSGRDLLSPGGAEKTRAQLLSDLGLLLGGWEGALSPGRRGWGLGKLIQAETCHILDMQGRTWN